MRSRARELGVKPMSLYHYVAGKDDILGGIVDLAVSEIDLPAAPTTRSRPPARSRRWNSP